MRLSNVFVGDELVNVDLLDLVDKRHKKAFCSVLYEVLGEEKFLELAFAFAGKTVEFPTLAVYKRALNDLVSLDDEASLRCKRLKAGILKEE